MEEKPEWTERLLLQAGWTREASGLWTSPDGEETKTEQDALARVREEG